MLDVLLKVEQINRQQRQQTPIQQLQPVSDTPYVQT